MTRAHTIRSRAASPAWQRARALGLALAGVVAVLVLWRLLVVSHTGQLMEDSALSGSLIGARFVSDGARRLLHVVSMPAAVALVLAILLVGLWRGSHRRALWAVAAVVATNGSAQVLKHVLLSRPDFGLSLRWDGANTLPSGHTAMAASAAVALVLIVGAGRRFTAAWMGAVGTAAMGYSTLVCQWHRPADVLAAIILAVAWGGAAVACGAWADDVPLRRQEPTGTPSSRTLLVLLGAGACLLALVGEVWTWRAQLDVVSRADTFVAYAAGSAATVGVSFVGMALIAGLTLRAPATLPGPCRPEEGPGAASRAQDEAAPDRTRV